MGPVLSEHRNRRHLCSWRSSVTLAVHEHRIRSWLVSSVEPIRARQRAPTVPQHTARNGHGQGSKKAAATAWLRPLTQSFQQARRGTCTTTRCAGCPPAQSCRNHRPACLPPARPSVCSLSVGRSMRLSVSPSSCCVGANPKP
jgi:hypothetical protein